MSKVVPDARVAIVLVNWNAKADLIECLGSLCRLRYNNFSVIVCDNESADGSVQAVEEWARGDKVVSPQSDKYSHIWENSHTLQVSNALVIDREKAESPQGLIEADAPLVVINTGENLGFAGGNNVGLRHALARGFDFFWVLNTDTIVHPDALSALVERAAQDADLGQVGSTLLYYWRPDEVQAMGGATIDRTTTQLHHWGIGNNKSAVPKDPTEVEQAISYVVGASILASRAFLEKVGLMCEDYFLYFEEADWALRGRRHAFRLGYAPQSVVYHKVGGSSAKVESDFSLRLLYRNRIKFVARFLPDRLLRTLFDLWWELLRHALKGRTAKARLLAGVLLDSRSLIAQGRKGAMT